MNEYKTYIAFQKALSNIKRITGSFDGPPTYRWTKMIAGKRYRVTCAELLLPFPQWTKTESLSAAQLWFEKTLRQEMNAIPQDKIISILNEPFL